MLDEISFSSVMYELLLLLLLGRMSFTGLNNNNEGIKEQKEYPEKLTWMCIIGGIDFYPLDGAVKTHSVGVH